MKKQTKHTPELALQVLGKAACLCFLPPSHQVRLGPRSPLLCFHIPSSGCRSLFGDHSLILLFRQISPMKPRNDGWTCLDLWTPLNIVEASFENERKRPSDMASDSSLRAHDERCQGEAASFLALEEQLWVLELLFKCENLRPLTYHPKTSVSSLVMGKKRPLERVPAYFNNNHELHFTAHLLAASTAGHL